MRGCEHIEAIMKVVEASNVNITAEGRWVNGYANVVLTLECNACGEKHEPESGRVGPG
jgi:hypothetical protein